VQYKADYERALDIALKLSNVVTSVAAGNLDDETYEQFYVRVSEGGSERGFAMTLSNEQRDDISIEWLQRRVKAEEKKVEAAMLWIQDARQRIEGLESERDAARSALADTIKERDALHERELKSRGDLFEARACLRESMYGDIGAHDEPTHSAWVDEDVWARWRRAAGLDEVTG
jgi:hypothetical protein